MVVPAFTLSSSFTTHGMHWRQKKELPVHLFMFHVSHHDAGLSGGLLVCPKGLPELPTPYHLKHWGDKGKI